MLSSKIYELALGFFNKITNSKVRKKAPSTAFIPLVSKKNPASYESKKY